MKKYEDLMIELVLLANSDVITASSGNASLDNDADTPEFPEFMN